jgi:hypothetical protein
MYYLWLVETTNWYGYLVVVIVETKLIPCGGLVVMGAREPENHLNELLGGYYHIKTVAAPTSPDMSLVKYLYQCQVRNWFSLQDVFF